MGTWGVGIFDNDVAADVRAAFEEALSSTPNITTATKRVLNQFINEVEDEDDRVHVYLALAFLQLELGGLQPDVRDEALQIIRSGQDLTRWEESEASILDERKRILQGLERKLTSQGEND